VVPMSQSAQLAERGMLRSKNSAATQDDQGSRNLGGHAGFEPLCRSHPRWPTPPHPRHWLPLAQLVRVAAVCNARVVATVEAKKVIEALSPRACGLAVLPVTIPRMFF
jgi:hypothetical protein